MSSHSFVFDSGEVTQIDPLPILLRRMDIFSQEEMRSRLFFLTSLSLNVCPLMVLISALCKVGRPPACWIYMYSSDNGSTPWDRHSTDKIQLHLEMHQKRTSWTSKLVTAKFVLIPRQTLRLWPVLISILLLLQRFMNNSIKSNEVSLEPLRF